MTGGSTKVRKNPLEKTHLVNMDSKYKDNYLILSFPLDFGNLSHP